MFDTQITTVLSATVGTPTDEALASGHPPEVELGIIVGLALPIPHPHTGHPLVIPAGKVRLSFTREQAIEIFEAALTAAQTLPEHPQASGKLMVASSMSDVTAAAENIRRVTGN